MTQSVIKTHHPENTNILKRPAVSSNSYLDWELVRQQAESHADWFQLILVQGSFFSEDAVSMAQHLCIQARNCGLNWHQSSLIHVLDFSCHRFLRSRRRVFPKLQLPLHGTFRIILLLLQLLSVSFSFRRYEVYMTNVVGRLFCVHVHAHI